MRVAQTPMFSSLVVALLLVTAWTLNAQDVSYNFMPLALRGMTKTDSDQADLYIVYQIAVNQETQWDVSVLTSLRHGHGIVGRIEPDRRVRGGRAGKWTENVRAAAEKFENRPPGPTNHFLSFLSATCRHTHTS